MILLKLFLTFLKIGAFTFGGGYAMLPFIQSEVLKNAWLSNEEIINFIAVSESTPGPFAINMATYVGMETGARNLGSIAWGTLGAACSTLGVVVPSFVIILIVAHFYEKFKDSKIVKAVMSGLKPAVIGLIGAAVLSVAKTVLLPNGFDFTMINIPELLVSIGIFAVMLFLVLKKKHPIMIIGISAAIGIAAGFILKM